MPSTTLAADRVFPEAKLSVPREQLNAALIAVQAAAAQDEPGLAEVARLVASASARLFRADHFEATEQQVTKAVLAAAVALRRARAQIRAMTLPSRIEAPLIEKLAVGIASLGEVGEQAADTCEPAWDASTHATASSRKGTRKLALVSDDGDPVTTGCAADHGAGASERREAERVVLEVELGLASDSNFYTGITMDVSTGGVFVATYQLLPMGALVELAFDLPGGHRVEVDGEVRWLRQSSANDSMPGMGIAFGALRRDDLEAIEAFCRSRTPLYHDID